MNGVIGDKRAIIEASDLSVAYDGRNALQVPSLQVFRDEVLVIIGPNGSGKTTLLLCLSLLLKPSSGTVSYDSVPVLDKTSILHLRRRIAVVFQEPLLLSGTVWDNVTLGLRLRKIPSAEIKVRARRWMERFGIWPLAGRQASTLSSGEAKRASLARAFVLQPQVLFMDEPFNSLDGPTHQSLMEDFESVLHETRVSTVMVTHDRDEAMALADRVGVLINGSMHQIDKADSVFTDPADEEVARFVQAGNILHGVVEGQDEGLAMIDVNGQKLQAVSALPRGSRATVFVSFDDVTVSLPSAEQVASSARNRFRGTVHRVFPFGHQTRVTIDCGFPLTAIVTKRSGEELGLAPGKEVTASFKASAVRIVR